MRILGFDVETTGLYPDKDRIIELAFSLWDVEKKEPVTMNSFLLHAKGISPQVERITGITQEMLDEFGVGSVMALAEFAKQARAADAYVAHNGVNFDIPFMQRAFRLDAFQWKDLPVIDTRTDIPYPPEVSSRKMQAIGAVHGVINPFAHRALTDTLVMLEILSQYNVQEIIDTVTVSPFVTLRADNYPGDGFWKMGNGYYQRRAREVYAEMELDNLRQKNANIKFDIISQTP